MVWQKRLRKAMLPCSVQSRLQQTDCLVSKPPVIGLFFCSEVAHHRHEAKQGGEVVEYPGICHTCEIPEWHEQLLDRSRLMVVTDQTY